MKRRLIPVLALVGMIMAIMPVASAAIHPIVCSRGVDAPGLANNPARSDDIANPPGITPDGDGPFGPHEDALGAADNNPVPQFRPLVVKFFGPANPNSLHSEKAEGACHNDPAP
jgi:hypothetical protein